MVEVIIAILGFGLFIYSITDIKLNQENLQDFFMRLKEDDFDFYAYIKYGSKASILNLMKKRFDKALIAFAIGMMLVFVTGFTAINILLVIVATYVGFKFEYLNLKKYYKHYISYIDSLLPYYLKQLEIMCQNYTVPVALSRSIEDAPEPFKEGIASLVSEIDAGDSSIEPYVRFAKKFPVKDSMRMMRLLFRLSLGSQENKHQQLVMFSKNVSSLQNKARQDSYRARLEKFEGKTKTMLIATGVLTLILLAISMIFMLTSFN